MDGYVYAYAEGVGATDDGQKPLLGKALNQQAAARIQGMEAMLTQGVSQEELDQFLATLEKLKANLSPARAPCEGHSVHGSTEVVRR